MRLTIERHPSQTGTYVLRTEFWLPRDIRDVFEFFSDAGNLEALTPPWLHFHVLTPQPIAMQAGALIEYRLRLHGVPIFWRTQIREWSPPFRFVDCQLRGPYRRWDHLHTFEPLNGGTLCRDEVNYAFVGGPLIHWLLVKRDLRRIFTYRHERLGELLGTTLAGTAPPKTE